MTKGELTRLGWQQAIPNTVRYWIAQGNSGWWYLATLDEDLNELGIVTSGCTEQASRDHAKRYYKNRLTMEHKNICKSLAQNS